ncbi:arginine exporter protein ArgO [Rhizobium pisi]
MANIALLAGYAALSWFTLQAFRAAFARKGDAAFTGSRETSSQCLRRVLAIIWLSSLTYVELLLVPAAIGQSMNGERERMQFAAALLVTSAICCLGYAFGGSLLARLPTALPLTAKMRPMVLSRSWAARIAVVPVWS